MKDKDLVDLDIADLTRLMEEGCLTAVELTVLCLNRICSYDRRGVALNAVSILNPGMFEEAGYLDAERRAGRLRGSLHGIPLVVKDSFKVAGLTVAAGSPAFADLVASDDAASVARLREAGALVIGKTNMPPMAIGGGQRSLYGKTSSPHNPDYLAAAWHSGSSIGSGVAVAAGFAPIGLAEETVSSGRSPASNNGLAAYTPSRGTVSIRGNWPLFALRDVVVPYARSLADLALVIREIAKPDPVREGDLWREQTHVEIPGASKAWARDPTEALTDGGLRGKRIGVPKMYVGRDTEARRPIVLRDSIRRLWEEAEAQLAALGAEIIHVEFPVVSEYEGDRAGAGTLASNGFVPEDWDSTEIGDLVASCWKQFLRLNGPSDGERLAETPPEMIHPDPADAMDPRRRASAHEGRDEFRYDRIIKYARSSPGRPLAEFPQLAAILRGLERARHILFEEWLAREGLDLVAFPANCDISRADAETDQLSSDHAWTNGTVFSNMNHVMRHLGIPSVSVPMGVMDDTAMPVSITFCGPAWMDFALLNAAHDYERASHRRVSPAFTPALALEAPCFRPQLPKSVGPIGIELSAQAVLNADGSVAVRGRACAHAGAGPAALSLFLDGAAIGAGTGTLEIDRTISRHERGRLFRSLLCALAYGGDGQVAARFIEMPYG
ncbi:amidase [Labrys okinawensis]|uniref:amidase n=1 Tax=Labrys okinawensis TaxID=346911 RepID=UPI0039BCA80B